MLLAFFVVNFVGHSLCISCGQTACAVTDYHHLLELYDIPDSDLLKIVRDMRDVNRKRREYKDAYMNLLYVKKILSTGLDKAGQRPMHPDKRRYVPRALPKKMFDQYDKVNQPEPEIIMLDRA